MPQRISPFINLSLKYFGVKLSIILRFNLITCCLNSGRKSFNDNSSNICKSDSFKTGLTSVKHSLFGKYLKKIVNFLIPVKFL